MDPWKMYIMSTWSIINPPSMVPIKMDTLQSNKKIPFANSGDSRTDDVTLYCAIEYTDPSNSENIINIQNSKIGSLTKLPTTNITIAKAIGRKELFYFPF